MLVLCEFNTGKAIPRPKRYLGETDQTDFSPLKVGGKYLVYGLLSISDRLDFLVCVSGQNPMWAPSSLFKLLDARIPDGWEICLTQLKPNYVSLYDMFKIHSIVGYPSLVNKFEHYVGVLERDPKDVQFFFTEKNRIDEWWGLIEQSSNSLLNSSGS